MNKNSNYRFNNNFDFLRVLAALLVILSHSFPLAGHKAEIFVSITGFMTFGYLGVIIFFVISGYLITKSWYGNPSTSQFFWNRFLRIVPGLVGVALFTIFLLGPFVTTLPVSDYFQNPATWNYLSIITIFGVIYTLPGVFTTNAFPNAVNGSIWTLPLEFKMYILVFITGFLKLHKRLILMILTLMLIFYFFIDLNFSTFFYNILYWNGASSIQQLGSSPVTHFELSYPLFFMIGSLYYLYEKKINYSIKLAVVLLIIWILSFNTPLFSIASFISLPYLVLYMAKTPVYPLNKISKYGDFSYGMYIYAFPVQQTVVHFISDISVIGLFLISSCLTLILSILSWKLIESKALKLKKFNIGEYFKVNILYKSPIYFHLCDFLAYIQKFKFFKDNEK
jgi:peptidoglycan/LPS O-acetylase OafA/YrhL